MHKSRSFEGQRVVDIDSDSDDGFTTSQRQREDTLAIEWEDIEGVIHNPGVEEAKKAGHVHLSPEDNAAAFPPRDPPCTCPHTREPWMKRQALFFLRSSSSEDEGERTTRYGKSKTKGKKGKKRSGRKKRKRMDPISDDIVFALHKYVGGYYAAQAAMDDAVMKYPNRKRNRRRDDAFNGSLEMQLLQGEKIRTHDCPCEFMEPFRGHCKVWTLFWIAIIYIFIWAFIWVHDVNGFPERYRQKQLKRLSELESLRREQETRTAFTNAATSFLTAITTTAMTTAPSVTASAGARATPTL
ncbi:hypothetical protein TWF696_008543 [Orbilia brochopaga]|uniref:Uncharacterized protein n=1 Tax=Orbilia brochopaga TaxID=3140254 RepID=A0AAV9UHG5_9PEZI